MVKRSDKVKSYDNVRKKKKDEGEGTERMVGWKKSI